MNTHQVTVLPASLANARAPGVVAGKVAVILRLEGLLVLICATACYAMTGGGWFMFAALFLAPDISMVGYLAGRRIGADIYNLGHSYLSPGCLAFAGFATGAPILLSLALIWVAHIGFDRLIGYGLKYPEGFGVTHLQMRV